MRNSKEILRQLNELLIMNAEIEKIYIEALNNVNDKDLKTFFRERGFERNQFSRDLKQEIENIGGKAEFTTLTDKGFYVVWMNFRKLYDNEKDLMDEVCGLKELTIEKYNKLLAEIHLPLSVFRLIEKQKEDILQTLRAIKTKNALVA